MSYADDIAAFAARRREAVRDVTVATALAMHESIVVGSGVSGAPGQPTDTGYLKTSWVVALGTAPSFPLDGKGAGRDGKWPKDRKDANPQPSAPQGSPAVTATIATNTEYAPYIEEGIKPTRSSTGGPGSVKLTRAAFNRFVDIAAADHWVTR